MNCPYLDCSQENIDQLAKECPQCRQWFKMCGNCGAPNRAFSNYCRICSEAFSDLNESWSGFKGSVQRTGLNRYVLSKSPPDLKLEEIKSIRFTGRCRSVLAADGYVIAVSDDGIINTVDLSRLDKEPYSFRIDGNVTAEPALHNGSLYIGALKNGSRENGRIYAYTLGGLSLTQPSESLRWQMDIKGKPVLPLLPFDDRLYLHMTKNGQRENYIIDSIKGNKPGSPSCVYKGERSGYLAADPPTRKVIFLSESRDALSINIFDHSTDDAPGMKTHKVKGAPHGLLDYIPIATIGSKLFAVFGNEKDLCRIDIQNNNFDAKITSRVRSFALAGMNKHIIINSTGIFSTAGNMQENLISGENIITGPIVLRDRAVLVGMRDGKIRFYKLSNLALQNEFQVFNSQFKVQSLAVFRDIIVVGNQDGDVKLLQLK